MVLTNGDPSNHYLCKPPTGTYCATTGTQAANFGVFETDWGWQLYLKDDFLPDYHGNHKYLYNATTGSVKYDEYDRQNTKQIWVVDHQSRKKITYGQPTHLLDVYTFSYLCGTDLSARDYSGGAGKCWVEGKKTQHVNLSHVDGRKWIFHKQ
jgi:hypothetical protein